MGKNFSRIEEGDTIYVAQFENCKLMVDKDENCISPVKVERIIRSIESTYQSIAFKLDNKYISKTVKTNEPTYVSTSYPDPIELTCMVISTSEKDALDTAFSLVNERVRRVIETKEKCENALDDLYIAGGIFEIFKEKAEDEVTEENLEEIASMAL